MTQHFHVNVLNVQFVIDLNAEYGDCHNRSHKYIMRQLQNILDLADFILLQERKSPSAFDCPWWRDCIYYVETSIFQDSTTTKANMHEKARTYALNYLAGSTEVSHIDKETLVEQIVDEVTKELESVNFDQRPPASVVAQMNRNRVPVNPEERFIKLG